MAGILDLRIKPNRDQEIAFVVHIHEYNKRIRDIFPVHFVLIEEAGIIHKAVRRFKMAAASNAVVPDGFAIRSEQGVEETSFVLRSVGEGAALNGVTFGKSVGLIGAFYRKLIGIIIQEFNFHFAGIAPAGIGVGGIPLVFAGKGKSENEREGG